VTTPAPRSDRPLSTIGVACLISAAVAVATARAQEKVPVKSLDDLPRHTYKIPGSVSELLKSDEQFVALARPVRADLEADLAQYQIEDTATLQRFRNVLVNLDLLEGRYDAVLKGVAVLRELETKEAKKLTTGLVAEALIAAREKAGADEAKLHAALQDALLQKLRALPWEVVGDDLKQRKGQMEMMTEPFLMGMVQSGIDPVVARTEGEISADIAQQVVNLRFILKIMLPLRDDLLAVYKSVVDEHGAAKKDIWAERAVTLASDQQLTPVVIGIWDSGVDTKVFEKQLWTDANQKADPVHGIAFDLDFQRTPALLHPLDGMQHDVAEVARHMKGFMDAQAAIDSPEAAAVKKVMSDLQGDDVKSFIEDLMLFGNYAHGTHVAGIASAGNPFARILVARLTFDYHLIPKCPTMEYYRAAAAGYQATVDYFKQHGVRVVNMSWGEDRATVERALEKNGVGGAAEERARMAREMYQVMRDGLDQALQSAPDILFVAAAGNSDNEVGFAELIPSGFDRPNVLVVGAVDQAGAPTGFTSFGKTVQVYACGFEVDSFIPGGQRMKLSGTSMAAPNVANLAAKLLALDPSLKPAQIIDYVKTGADKVEGQRPLLLIHPQRTLALLKR
jgi:subtilisin family serine protease